MKITLHKPLSIVLFLGIAFLIYSCGDKAPTSIDEESDIIVAKEEEALKQAEKILPEDFLSSLKDEIDNQPVNLKETYLDSLKLSLEQLVDTVDKYHSASVLKNEILRISNNAQKSISREGNESKAKAFSNLGLGYGKGVSIDAGSQANAAVGIADGLSAQGGGGSEVLYDFVNMDSEVYIFSACGIGSTLIGAGVGASLSASVGVSGYKKWLLNIAKDERSNKFEGPAKASNFGITGSGFLGVVGLSATVSVGQAQDIEGDANFYNLTECPSYFDSTPNPNGIKELFFEVSVDKGVGIGKELIAALEAGQIGSNRTAIPGSFKNYDNFLSSRKLSSYKMSAEILTSSPVAGLNAGFTDGADLTAAALAIIYGGLDPSVFDEPKPVLSFSPEVFDISSLEDSYQLVLSNIGTGNLEWAITPPNVNWISVNQTSGTNEAKIDINVDENTTSEDRTAELFITSNGGNSDAIFITQRKKSPTGNLIASYPFNGNANDESGNGFDGTVNGATLTSDRFGNSNSAYEFDGNSGITVNSYDALQINGDVSISGWFKMNTPPTSNYIIFDNLGSGESLDTNGLYFLDVHSDGRLRFGHEYGNGLDEHFFTTNPVIENNMWYHFTQVRDVSNKEYKIYLNGNLIDSIEFNNFPEKDTNGNIQKLFIGSRGGTSTDFIGIIDDIKIYNYPLNEDSIKDLYTQNGWSGGTISGDQIADGLVAYWTFDNFTNQEIVNSVDRNDDLVIQNNPSPIEGVVSNAISLNGSNDDEAYTNNYVTSSFPLTYNFWTYHDGSTETTGYFSDGTGGSYKGIYVFRGSDSDVVDLRIAGDNGSCSPSGRRSYYSANKLIKNEWNHVAIVIRSITDVEIYINNQPGTVYKSGSASTVNIGSGDQFSVGTVWSCASSSKRFYNSTSILDELGIWNRELNTQEISKLYSNGEGFKIY